VAMDRDHTILYLNPAAAEAAGKPREACIGVKFWDLFDNPGCRAGTCAAAQAVNTGKACTGEALPVVQGKRIAVRVTAAPVFDERHQVVGVAELIYPVEAELQTSDEILRLSKAAKDGKLAERASLEGADGRYRQLLEGVNAMLDAVIKPLNVSAEFVERIAKGDIPPKITDSYDGDFNQIKNNLNACITGLGGLVEANGVLQRMAVNDYTKRVEGTYAGVFADVARATNSTMDRLLHVRSTLQKVAQGDLGDLPEYKRIGRRSEHDELVPALIAMMEGLAGLVADANMLAGDAVQGKLATRADATKHQGDFRRVIEGVNQTLDAVVKPIRAASLVLGKIAAKDLKARVEGEHQGDFAQLKEDINKMAADLQDSMRQFSQNAQALASSSEEMSAVSQQMSGNAEETATQANIVSAASEQVSKNVSSVASASEEMQSSIREIAKNANESARVAKNAVSVAHSTNETVKNLGESSQEIGNVIKVITSIAQQTNLLALNATIEAARAGEAGKGFAVVANEVKELAKQTAKATEDIGRKIEAIQGDAKGAVKAIEEIGTIINQINDISNSIASAVEEQTVTTNEIGRSVTEAAKGVNDIARNIGGVATAARSTTQGANDTKTASLELSEMAARLQAAISRFTF